MQLSAKLIESHGTINIFVHTHGVVWYGIILFILRSNYQSAAIDVLMRSGYAFGFICLEGNSKMILWCEVRFSFDASMTFKTDITG
jgi:hypothetical protein